MLLGYSQFGSKHHYKTSTMKKINFLVETLFGRLQKTGKKWEVKACEVPQKIVISYFPILVFSAKITVKGIRVQK